MTTVKWVVPSDSEARVFDTREAALARAWELTPAGGVRAEPVERHEMTVVKSVTDDDVRYMTWKHIMAPGEVYSAKIKRIGMQEMSRAASAFNYELMASTYRYNTDGNVVTFYCDARKIKVDPTWVRGQIATNASDEKIIYTGDRWVLMDTAEGKATARDMRFEAGMADMRYGMISDD